MLKTTLQRLQRPVIKVQRQGIKDSIKSLRRSLGKVRNGLRRRTELLPLPMTNELANALQQVMTLQHLYGLLNARRTLNSSRTALNLYQDTLAALQRTLRLQPGQVRRIERAYRQSAFNVAEELEASVEQELREFVNGLIAQQLPTRQMVGELENKFDALGITPRNSYAIENLVRTQSQLAYNAGKYIGEQDPDFQEILWGYRYVTTGDNRVRDEHAVLEGVTLPKADPFWQRYYPPNGWSCRCSVIPLFEPAEEVQPKEEVEIEDRFSINPGQFLLDL